MLKAASNVASKAGSNCWLRHMLGADQCAVCGCSQLPNCLLDITSQIWTFTLIETFGPDVFAASFPWFSPEIQACALVFQALALNLAALDIHGALERRLDRGCFSERLLLVLVHRKGEACAEVVSNSRRERPLAHWGAAQPLGKDYFTVRI